MLFLKLIKLYCCQREELPKLTNCIAQELFIQYRILRILYRNLLVTYKKINFDNTYYMVPFDSTYTTKLLLLLLFHNIDFQTRELIHLVLLLLQINLIR